MKNVPVTWLRPLSVRRFHSLQLTAVSVSFSPRPIRLLSPLLYQGIGPKRRFLISWFKSRPSQRPRWCPSFPSGLTRKMTKLLTIPTFIWARKLKKLIRPSKSRPKRWGGMSSSGKSIKTSARRQFRKSWLSRTNSFATWPTPRSATTSVASSSCWTIKMRWKKKSKITSKVLIQIVSRSLDGYQYLNPIDNHIGIMLSLIIIVAVHITFNNTQSP